MPTSFGLVRGLGFFLFLFFALALLELVFLLLNLQVSLRVSYGYGICSYKKLLSCLFQGFRELVALKDSRGERNNIKVELKRSYLGCEVGARPKTLRAEN